MQQQMILEGYTRRELLDDIRKIVREEFAKVDPPLSRPEVAKILKISVQTVDRWTAKGTLNRINPEGQHPKFSKLEIMNLKKERL